MPFLHRPKRNLLLNRGPCAIAHKRMNPDALAKQAVYLDWLTKCRVWQLLWWESHVLELKGRPHTKACPAVPASWQQAKRDVCVSQAQGQEWSDALANASAAQDVHQNSTLHQWVHNCIRTCRWSVHFQSHKCPWALRLLSVKRHRAESHASGMSC